MEESVEDALRDLGIEMPKPASQSWHFNPRVPRSVPKHELKGEYLLITLRALEDGSPEDKLVFDGMSDEQKNEIGAIAFAELSKRAESAGGDCEGKAMVGHVVAALQKALASAPPAPAKSFFSFDRTEKQGARPSMEDRSIIISDVNRFFGLKSDERQTFFGVFDGHAGVDAAHFTQAHLLTHIVENPHFNSDIKTALREAHLSIDKLFASKPSKSGCTSITMFVRGNKAYLSWLGDSAAILSRAGKHVTLMDPHKPGRLDERERIENAGGMVMQVFGVWRVNGMLSVARAIGDHNLKQFIIADPDITEFELVGDEEFIVLACDGLWDVMRPEEVVEYVRANTKRSESGAVLPGVADELAEHAISLGSTDNVSIIIAHFNAAPAPAAAAAAAAAPAPAS